MDGRLALGKPSLTWLCGWVTEDGVMEKWLAAFWSEVDRGWQKKEEKIEVVKTGKIGRGRGRGEVGKETRIDGNVCVR